MSTTGQDYPSAPGARDPRAMSEDEWRASLPNFGQQLGTGLGHSSSASVAAPAAAPSVAPFSTQPGPSRWRAAPTSSNTPWVWWLIFAPIIGGILVWPIAIALFGWEGIARVFTQETVDGSALAFFGYLYGFAFLAFAAVIVLAYKDRSALRRLGHTRTASPWWHLLSQLAYLIARTVYVRSEVGRGAAPLVVYICIQILPFVLVIIAAIAIPAFLSSYTPSSLRP